MAYDASMFGITPAHMGNPVLDYSRPNLQNPLSHPVMASPAGTMASEPSTLPSEYRDAGLQKVLDGLRQRAAVAQEYIPRSGLLQMMPQAPQPFYMAGFEPQTDVQPHFSISQ